MDFTAIDSASNSREDNKRSNDSNEGSLVNTSDFDGPSSSQNYLTLPFEMSSLFMQCLTLGFSLIFFIVLIILLQQYHLDNHHRLIKEVYDGNGTSEIDWELEVEHLNIN